MTPLETIMKRLDDIEFRAGMPEGFFSPEDTQALWTQSRKEDIPALVAALKVAVKNMEELICICRVPLPHVVRRRCEIVSDIAAALGGEVGKDGDN